jgi:hypothetical protein
MESPGFVPGFSFVVCILKCFDDAKLDQPAFHCAAGF